MTSSQDLESYVPVYDTVPEKWEEGRMFLVEHLKKITNALNVREIGWFLDEELLSGKQFIPIPNPGSPKEFRSVFRIVVDVAPLVVGANVKPHGITVDVNFTLVDLWVAATNSVAFTSEVITDTNVTLDVTNININSPGAFDRAFCVIEYMREI